MSLPELEANVLTRWMPIHFFFASQEVIFVIIYFALKTCSVGVLLLVGNKPLDAD